MDTKQINQIKELRSEGYSLGQIAKEIGCSRGTVQHHCISGTVNTVCNFCGKAIYRRPSRKKNADKNFCSIPCRNSFYSNDKHPSWKGGKRDRVKDHAVSKLRTQKNKEKAVSLLGGKCSKCNYDKCVAALDFHHIDPTTKDDSLKNLMRGSWKKIKTELEKCILLCANCHREHHWSENKNNG